MKAALQFSYQNATESVVGAEGLHPGDLDQAAALAALDAFRKRVDSGEIGFPNLPDDRTTIRAVSEFAADTRGEVDDVLVVGIGGSALGAYALDAALRGPHPVQIAPGVKGKRREPRPRLVVLDNVDPGFIAAALQRVNPKRTLACVIAKSGSTAESLSTFLIVREWMEKALGKRTRARIVAVTDAQKGDLLAIAKQERYPLFFVPGNVGGRFSVFTPVGLLPAALIGLDIGKLMRGAGDANLLAWSRDFDHNLALTSAAVHHALHTKRGKAIEVVYAYSSYLWGAAFWYRQLWAESLGKRVNRKGEVVETGQTPVAALGVTDQHSQSQLYMEGPRDKMITFWAVKKPRADVRIPRAFAKFDSCGYLGGKKLSELFHAEMRATEAALTEAGRPNCRWTLPVVDEYTVGAFFQTLEFQTAFAGELYGVDAFDQPGVELGKKLTYGLLGRKGYEEFAKRVK
ncbi:MAG TPA: glucose-6-phosphate isomerase [Terriglobales bacterium]|nr:glucose-6-phosphate isomerase [Terriglobales bacterium]